MGNSEVIIQTCVIISLLFECTHLAKNLNIIRKFVYFYKYITECHPHLYFIYRLLFHPELLIRSHVTSRQLSSRWQERWRLRQAWTSDTAPPPQSVDSGVTPTTWGPLSEGEGAEGSIATPSRGQVSTSNFAGRPPLPID